MRVPNPSSVRIDAEILVSTGAGVWRNAPGAFPHSISALDKVCL